MTKEKKKEVAKKPEDMVNAFTELSCISTTVTEAMREQEQISQSISNMMKATETSMYSGILTSLDCVNGSLSSIEQISTSWRENEAILSAIGSSTCALGTLETIGSQVKEMYENIESIGKLINPQEAKLAEIIIPKIKEVDSQKDTIIKSLVSQIEYLESELSKKDTKIRELLALLEEERKDLKKQYVS